MEGTGEPSTGDTQHHPSGDRIKEDNGNVDGGSEVSRDPTDYDDESTTIDADELEIEAETQEEAYAALVIQLFFRRTQAMICVSAQRSELGHGVTVSGRSRSPEECDEAAVSHERLFSTSILQRCGRKLLARIHVNTMREARQAQQKETVQEELEECVVQCQQLARGFLARKERGELLEQSKVEATKEVRGSAATTIQALARGWYCRRWRAASRIQHVMRNSIARICCSSSQSAAPVARLYGFDVVDALKQQRLQRTWLLEQDAKAQEEQHYTEMATASALVLQRATRRHLARKEIQIERLVQCLAGFDAEFEDGCARLVQRGFRLAMFRRHRTRAAQVIQLFYKRRVAIARVRQLRQQRTEEMLRSVQEDRTEASAALQRFARKMAAERMVGLRRWLMVNEQQQIRRAEASECLQRWYPVVLAMRRRRDLRVQRDQYLAAELLKLHTAAAIKIQAFGRMLLGRYAKEARRGERRQRDLKLVDDDIAAAATMIQSYQRGIVGRREAARVAQLQKEALEFRRMTAAATRLQTRFRGMRARNFIRRQFRVAAAVKVLSCVTRGFLTRSYLLRVKAVSMIERLVKCYLARADLRRRRRNQLLDDEILYRNLAATKIQKLWRGGEGRVVAAFLAEYNRLNNEAAQCIQRTARSFLARKQFRALQAEAIRKAEAFRNIQLFADVQRVLLGFIGRRRAKAAAQGRTFAGALLRNVGRGMICRVACARDRYNKNRTTAATSIQCWWRQVCGVLEAERRLGRRLQYVEEIRRREEAAVQIQRVERGRTGRRYAREIVSKRRNAAQRITGLVMMALARRRLRMLRDQKLQADAARKIQSVWGSVRFKKVADREEQELMDAVWRVEFKEVVRREAHFRAEAIEEQIDAINALRIEYRTATHKLVMELAELQERRRRQVQPIEVQNEAAMKLQKMARGLAGRSLARMERGQLPDSTTIRKSFVAPEYLEPRGEEEEEGVRSDSEADNTLGPSSFTVWLLWLREHADNFPNIRAAERLVQREVGSRRKVEEEQQRMRNVFVNGQRALHRSILHTTPTPLKMQPTTRHVLPPVGRVAAVPPAVSPRPTSGHELNRTGARRPLPPVSELASATIGGPQSAEILAPVVQMLRCNSNNIRELVLSHRGLTSVPLQPLLEALKTNRHVQHVDLSSNLLRDATCVEIAEMLCENTSIVTISLAGNNITDVGATHLVAALRRNSCLRVLDVSRTLVSDRYRGEILRHLVRRAPLAGAPGSAFSRSHIPTATSMLKHTEVQDGALAADVKSDEESEGSAARRSRSVGLENDAAIPTVE